MKTDEVFGNLVAAVDFSNATSAVIRTTLSLAKSLHGEVVLLHISEPEPDFVGFGPDTPPMRDSTAHEYRSDHLELEKLKPLFEKAGIKVSALHLRGSFAEKITQTAAQVKASMIVMGSHGHGALHHLLAGSVTTGVLQAAECPVLVVPVARA